MLKPYRLPFATLLLLLFFSASIGLAKAQGRTIYVSVNCTAETEAGSPQFPYHSLFYTILAAQPGDTILVAPGVYNDDLVFLDKSKVTLRSITGPEQTILRGLGLFSTIQIGSKYIASDVTIDGFTIQNGGGLNSYILDGYGIVVGANTSGTRTVVSIKNNIISANQRGGIGIRTGWSNTQFEVEIEDNLIINNIDIFKSTSGGGIYVDGFDSGYVAIRNNVIAFNETLTGAGMSYYNAGTDQGKIILTNNTIFGNVAHSQIGGIWVSNNAEIVNNIIYGNSAINFPDSDEVMAYGNTVTNNIIGHSPYAGQDDNLSVDPLLVDPANGDFHLQSGSPAIDAGTTTAVTVDFEGNRRPHSGDSLGPALWDIGADEYVPPFSFEPNSFIYLPLILSADPLAQVCLN